MCAGSNMGSHCTTCITTGPIEPSSSSANLTSNNENVVDHEMDQGLNAFQPPLIASKAMTSNSRSNNATHISTTQKSKGHSSSLGNIHEEKEQNLKFHDHNHISPNIMHKIGVNPNTFQRIEASQTMTSTRNTNTAWSPSSKPAHSSDDVHDHEVKPYKDLLKKMKVKHSSKQHHEYIKANSFEKTVTRCTSSSAHNLLTDNRTDTTPDDTSSDDEPGPPPKLSLFNNSNRPPLMLRDHYVNKRSSDLSEHGLSINIERTEDTLTHSRLSCTKTSVTCTWDTVDRLKIPKSTSLTQSVSAYDELGKKLNHMPTFQRAFTTSFTSLTSQSQSGHLSFEKSLKLRDSAPSFHSMHSMHSLRSLRTTPTTTNEEANNLFNNIMYGHGLHTPPVNTAAAQHMQPSFDMQHMQSLDMQQQQHTQRVSLTPSLPSISAKDTLDSEQLNIRFTSSHDSSSKFKNNLNPLDLVQKRVLFVSLVQLHRSYLNGIPSFVLEHAVFVFGIKKIWLFPQTKDEMDESKDSYIEHFRSSWSKEFLQMIANKDNKGHVLWIEPCQSPKAHSVWQMISSKLAQIVDLSVSEEETKRKKKEIELELLQVQQAQKRAHSAAVLTEEKEDSIANFSSTLMTDNEIQLRFPSDRTDSIPPDVPTMSYVAGDNTPISSMFSKNPNNHSLQTIEDDEDEKKQMGIADTLLQIHHSKEELVKVGSYPTVFMTDAEEDDGMHTDSDYDDDAQDNKPLPALSVVHNNHKKAPVLDISCTDLVKTPKYADDTQREDITPPVTEEALLSLNMRTAIKSRPTEKLRIEDYKTQKSLKISVEDVSKVNHIKVDPNKYLPYYNKLRLEDIFWKSKYEPVRQQQSDQLKLALAESAKLRISPKQHAIFTSSQLLHNESINLAIQPVKSLFNVEGEEVLKQLRCISTPNDIKLKPIKELFYQSNPTLIPMEYFEWNKYIEYHMDTAHKYFDIIQYCERFCMPNADLTPSHSSHTRSRSHNNTSSNASNTRPKLVAAVNNNSSPKRMEMLDDDEDEDDEEDDGLKNAGFEMIDNVSSNPFSANHAAQSDDFHSKQQVNVDESGMVYMFDYDDDIDEDESYFDSSTQKRSIPIQLSFKPDSELPFDGRLRGGASESSVQLFD